MKNADKITMRIIDPAINNGYKLEKTMLKMATQQGKKTNKETPIFPPGSLKGRYKSGSRKRSRSTLVAKINVWKEYKVVSTSINKSKVKRGLVKNAVVRL